MEDFIKRMIDEYKLNLLKTQRLAEYMTTDKFLLCGKNYKYYTQMQYQSMVSCCEYLKARIKCLGYNV